MSDFEDAAPREVLSAAFRASIDGLAVLDPDGTYVRASRTYAEIYGASGDLTGRSWRDHYGDDEVARLEAEACPALSETGRWRGTAVGRRADGESFEQELSLARTGGDHVVAVVRDVSERRSRRQALERSETILGSIRDAVYTLDAEGTITWVNQTAVEEFDAGYTREDLVGAHASMILSDEDFERCLEIVRDLLSEDGPESGRCEIALQTAYGDEIPCDLHLTLLPFEDGEFQGTVGVIRDVSERKRREQRLSVLNRVLRHNLRNHATVLYGQLTDLEHGIDGDAGDHVRRMREAVDEVATLSRKAGTIAEILDRGGGEAEPIDVARVVEESAAALRDRYPGASVSVDAPSELAARATHQLHVAVDELLENAVVHAEDDPHVVVSVEGPETKSGWVTVEVADDGPGIPQAEVDALFEEIERPLAHGSGLGLWCVRWYVDSIGGELVFEEPDPPGSVVTIRLRPA